MSDMKLFVVLCLARRGIIAINSALRTLGVAFTSSSVIDDVSSRPYSCR